MAYDERAGERLREAIAGTRGLTESRMFGGLTFLVNGNMCCGIAGDELVVRVDWDRSEVLAERKHARPCDITGRPMRGLVTISPRGFKTAASLNGWVREAVGHASSLPPKAKKKSSGRQKVSKRKASKKTARKKGIAKAPVRRGVERNAKR